MRWHFQGRRVLYAAIGSAMALAVGIAHSTNQTSEIDSYEAAVRSQSKVDALNFVRDFRSSHLVGDLIKSLRPEVAEQVCLELQDGGPARTREACEALHAGFAVQPDVQTVETVPAAGIAVSVNPLPLGADTSAGAFSDDDETATVQEPIEANQGDMPDAGATDQSATSASSNSAIEPVSAGATKSTSAPSNANDADLFYLPVATAAPTNTDAAMGPVSTATVIATKSPALAKDFRGDEGTGDTSKSDGANTFLQIPRIAHIARNPSVSLVPLSAPASTGVSSGNSPVQSGGAQNTGETSGIQSSDTQSSDDPSSTDQSSSSTHSNSSADISSDQSDNGQKDKGKKGSVQSSNDKSSSEQGNGDQGTSSAPSNSSAEISSDQSDNGQKGKGKKGTAQSSNDQSSSSGHSDSSADISSDQSGEGKEGKDKGSKNKGGKDKEGKKGGKDKGGG
jgi:hypothetical protein